MRLAITCVFAALLPVTASAAPQRAREPVLGTQVVRKTCARPQHFAKTGQVGVYRHPRDHAPVDLHHAVDRRVDNCPVPAIVRRNVGR